MSIHLVPIIKVSSESPFNFFFRYISTGGSRPKKIPQITQPRITRDLCLGLLNRFCHCKRPKSLDNRGKCPRITSLVHNSQAANNVPADNEGHLYFLPFNPSICYKNIAELVHEFYI